MDERIESQHIVAAIEGMQAFRASIRRSEVPGTQAATDRSVWSHQTGRMPRYVSAWPRRYTDSQPHDPRDPCKAATKGRLLRTQAFRPKSKLPVWAREHALCLSASARDLEHRTEKHGPAKAGLRSGFRTNPMRKTKG
jgi:hypothetical protein